MTSLQEYDLEITPAQIIRGQGLCKLMDDSVEEQESQMNTSTINQHNQKQTSCAQVAPNSWYENIRFYLTHGSSSHNIDPKNRRALRLKSTSFQLINDVLFQENFDGVLMHCLEKEELEQVLSELHVGEFSRHFSGDTTSQKVLRDGYYWPTLFKYAHALCRKCIIYQKMQDG
jgi:hypothetical protein